MDIVSIIIVSLIALFAVIGAVTGVAKGFTQVKSWAVEMLLAGVISIALSKLFSSKLDDGTVKAILSLGICLVLVCLLMLVFVILRKRLSKSIEKRKQKWYYEHYDEIEGNTEQILSALGKEDTKTYNKLTKRKFRQSGGAWGVVDRVFGGVTLAIKGAVMSGIFFAVVLAVLDFSRLPAEGGALYEALGDIYSSSIWAFFKNFIFDFLLVGILMVCIKSGYSSGISSAVWTLVVIGLIGGAGYLSFHLSTTVPSFVSVAGNLEAKLADKLAGVAGILEGVGLTTLKLCEILIGIGIFALMLVAVILIAVFVPRLIDRARDSVIVRSIDGVFGAIIFTAVCFGIIFMLGAVLKTIYEVQFMDVFNAYFEKSGIATWIYDKNPVNLDLPLKDLLT